MRLTLLIMTALVAQLGGGAAKARVPVACHRCHTICGDAVSGCVAAASCPATPRGRAHRCLRRAKHRCRSKAIAGCTATCRRTGSPVCTTAPSTCGPYTSTCDAVPLTPVQVSNSSSQVDYGFNAITGSPGPGSCCVIDECAGVTLFAAAGGVNVFYREVVFLDPINHQVSNSSVTTKLGVTCSVPTPTSVYGLSDIYQVNFDIDSLPPTPPDWTAPYVVSPGDLAVSIDSTNDPLPSHRHNTFTPSTWRLTNQTVSVDKVCAEQQLMQGHGTASFIKNDGTPCTVTIYSQGTRVVSGP